MRILVTGAFGYLGLALLKSLQGKHALVAHGHKPRNETALSLLSANTLTMFGDVLEISSTIQQYGPFDVVIHLAGGGGLQKCQADPVKAVRSNVHGTRALVKALQDHASTRLLFTSSIAVYGTYRQHGPYSETDDTQADDFYGVLKEATEHCVMDAGGTVLRLANVYGAGCGVDLALDGAVERFARAVAQGQNLQVYGLGDQRIDYVHVDDVVAAMERAFLVRQPLPPIVNLGGGNPVAIGELANMCISVGQEFGAKSELQHRPAPEGKVWPNRSLAIDLAKAILQWQPRISMVEGVRELVLMMKGRAT